VHLDPELAVCPPDLTHTLKCLNDTSWLTTPGWRTKLAVSYRRANVAYTWADGNALEATFPDNETETPPLLASDVRRTFDYLLRPINTSSKIGQAFATFGLGSGRPITPLYVATYFYEYGDLSKASESGQRRVMTALQSLVSIPIHYCQAASAYQVVGLGSNSSIPLVDFISRMLPKIQPDTRITPATESFAIAVGLDALVPFAAINGFALLLCCAVLAVSSCSCTVDSLRDARSLPTLWRDTTNQIADRENEPVAEKDRQALADSSLREKLSMTRDWRVTCVKGHP
jgi:hypothetical protein